MMARQKKLWWIGLAAGVLAACSPTETSTGPVEFDDHTVCALDGMSLAEYPGPKAQIQYEGDPAPAFFCDTTELFSLYLKPEQVRKISTMYVQDLSKTTWEKPRGAWVDAKAAWYVLGSRKHGAMGPTIASFSVEQDAQNFITAEGGKLYRFEQVTSDLISLDGGALHDQHGM